MCVCVCVSAAVCVYGCEKERKRSSTWTHNSQKRVRGGETLLETNVEEEKNVGSLKIESKKKNFFMSTKRETNLLLSDSLVFFLLAFLVAFGKCVQHDFISREEISGERLSTFERRSARML